MGGSIFYLGNVKGFCCFGFIFGLFVWGFFFVSENKRKLIDDCSDFSLGKSLHTKTSSCLQNTFCRDNWQHQHFLMVRVKGQVEYLGSKIVELHFTKCYHC